MPKTTETNQTATFVANQQDETPRIEIREHITRELVRAEKDKIFLFGDNLTGRGFGGQAKEMRGEENTIGIPTKKAPSNSPNSFFTDHEFAANKKAIDEAFQKIPPAKTVVIPQAGLGTGLARLAEKAPNTFAYLNEKLAAIGFHNPVHDSRESPTNSANKVIVQNANFETPSAKRLLDLNNIQTASLRGLSPTEKEIEAVKIDARLALADYAERLRQDYRTNKDNLRDGLGILSDSLKKGEQITVTCSCRTGALCHADVVKMAVEKVNARIKDFSINKTDRNDQSKTISALQENSRGKQVSHEQTINPRTRAAINEIFSFGENDRVLQKINQTDGRNRSEQASHLGKSSQFIRDIYEHGGHIADGYLIVPQEKLNDSPVLAITTKDYAVKKLNKILQDENRAKELASLVVEYGNKIGGVTADGETKLKVFGWIYDSLEGKSALQENGEKSDFNETLEKIRDLAEEMHSLEPLDKTEFVPLGEIEKNYSAESSLEKNGETLNLGEIYEEAISLAPDEPSFELEPNEKIKTEGFERIDLNRDVPRIPEDYTPAEIFQLINETLPEIDRQLENGILPKEILAPFNEAIWQSARDDAQKRLESIYQKQKRDQTPAQVSEKELKTSDSLDRQLAKIDLGRQNIIELKKPTEYLQAEKEAIKTFYRRQKQEIGLLLTKIDEVREEHSGTSEKEAEIVLKKQLNQTREAQPNFAFKLENSAEIVIGHPSEETIEKRNFISSYLSYQLAKPETRLRYENERYRLYAAHLESAATRDDVMKISSEIRAENAGLGLGWKDLKNEEKENLPRPLTRREMQFLFTESSPAHYTGEMTAVRLSFAHSGVSRRAITESLLKGEIAPSPEARKLIESLESRLHRRDLKDSLLATKHFHLSVKNPNESLKHKNDFDHREIYQKLPPQEKDFVYQKASQQKENLEYQLAFKTKQLKTLDQISLAEQSKTKISPLERSFHLYSLFHQALVLGDRIDSKPLVRSEIKSRDVKAAAILLMNQSAEKLENLADELNKSENAEKKKIGEVVRIFSRAEIFKDENKTTISIKLPEKALVSRETYRELLERFYPHEERENEKYKFENLNEKEKTSAREKGQDETLKNFRDEIESNIYRKDVSIKVDQIAAAVTEKLDKIARFQTEARNARAENESLTLKYAARVTAKMQRQKRQVPSALHQQKIVSSALNMTAPNLISNKIHSRFFQAVQQEITLTDFEKFAGNEKLLNEAKASIKNEFAEISESLQVLAEAKLPAAKNVELNPQDQNHANMAPHRETTAGKPLSLSIFEKELEKAERELIRQGLKGKFSQDIDLEKNFDPNTVFSNAERTAIKSAALEIVKEKLEPKELNLNNRKISPEASRQAFVTYKQLERAAQIFQTGEDQSKITDAFFKLDDEASKLNQIRQNDHHQEKIGLLRDGIKTDLADFFKKNQALKPDNFEAEINRILLNNLSKSDFVKPGEDGKQVSILSRQIAEKLEAKQILALKDQGLSADSREAANSAPNSYSLKNDQTKTNVLEKSKDVPAFTRG